VRSSSTRSEDKDDGILPSNNSEESLHALGARFVAFVLFEFEEAGTGIFFSFNTALASNGSRCSALRAVLVVSGLQV
jgi:hypothetical protein